jgi:hypothetical protein
MSFLLNPFVFAGAAGDFESIATVTVGSGGAAEIEFTSIPGTYQHLHLRLCVRSLRSATSAAAFLQYNDDTDANNYVRYHWLRGDGSSASAGATTTGSAAQNIVGEVAAASATASIFGVAVVDILDYADTSKNTVVRSLQGHDRNGAGEVGLNSGLWIDTDTITKIAIGTNAGNLAEHSTAALYGIKA